MSGPVVAELGRPETPEETAERKAAASRAYRSSQTMRNLIAAMLVTLGMLAIIVFAVPRGTLATPAPVDIATLAAEAESVMQRPVLMPDLGDQWRVNAAELGGGPVTVWDITLAPATQAGRGFARIAQAFDQNAAWAPLRLSGTAPTGTVQAGGYTWDEFVMRTPESTANISYALGTQAGRDYVLIYGSLTAEATAALAASLTAQLERISEGR